MYSLFNALTDQHGAELEPVRCNRQTVRRLLGYFEDLVTDTGNSVVALEGRCPDNESPRDAERLQRLANEARHLFLFTCDRYCRARKWDPGVLDNLTLLAEREYHHLETGPFIVVIESNFCGLLSCREITKTPANSAEAFAVVWTFDPNVVYTAIEYLLARLGAQWPDERIGLQMLLNAMTMHQPSLQVALKFTTRLAALLQRQSELEMASSRISSAISANLELDGLLQTAVDEVGRALNARRAAVVLWQEGTSRPERISIYERADEKSPPKPATAMAPYVEPQLVRPVAERPATRRRAGAAQPRSAVNGFERAMPGGTLRQQGSLEAPLTYRAGIIGVLVVEDDAPSRDWEDEEVSMVRAVADQLAIAVCHARLSSQIQAQVISDPLTGLNNHRHFQEQLDREIKLADRNNESISLILLDLDHLKRINETLGHQAGDAALCHVAFVIQSVVRDIDICARYGGEEFVIVLPQCGREHALSVAERVREAIAVKPAPKVGEITASIGVATYPASASSKEELIEMAGRAMHRAKQAGRNRVRWVSHKASDGMNV